MKVSSQKSDHFKLLSTVRDELEKYSEECVENQINCGWGKEKLDAFFRRYAYTLDEYIADMRRAGEERICKSIAYFEKTYAPSLVHDGFYLGNNRLTQQEELLSEDEVFKRTMRIGQLWVKSAVQEVGHMWFCPLILASAHSISVGMKSYGNDFFNLVQHAFSLYRIARKTVPDIMGKLPVLFFGALSEYFSSDFRILTLGRMPSSNEFIDGVPRFREDEIDYDKMYLPVKRPWEDGEYVSVCDSYFERQPNMDYFRCFAELLPLWNGDYYCERKKRHSIQMNRVWGRKRGEKDVRTKYPLQNIAVHFNYSSLVAVRHPWEELSESERQAICFEKHFPALFQALAPDVVLCDFDIAGTWLAENVESQSWEALNLPRNARVGQVYRKNKTLIVQISRK